MYPPRTKFQRWLRVLVAEASTTPPPEGKRNGATKPISGKNKNKASGTTIRFMKLTFRLDSTYALNH